MPDRVESLREVHLSRSRLKDQPRFVKPHENVPRKEHNLIESRPSKAEIGQTGRENGIRFQKEE